MFDFKANFGDKMIVEPDTGIGFAENIEFDVVTMQLLITPDVEEIKIPSELVVNKRDNEILIESKDRRDFTKTYRILLPATKFIRKLNIKGVGHSIKGVLQEKAELITINGTGISIGATLKANGIKIDGTGISISGVLLATDVRVSGPGISINGEIISDKTSIDGQGISLKGYVESKYLGINGVGLSINVELKNVEKISVSGTGLSGTLNYLDEWDGTRYANISGVGSKVKIKTLPGGNGELKVSSSGMFSSVTAD